jgi:hypothetical protein
MYISYNIDQIYQILNNLKSELFFRKRTEESNLYPCAIIHVAVRLPFIYM